MPTSDTSYFSRFFVKFVEIVAAGLATAVSGYLIAHLSGAFSPPTQAPSAAAIQSSPSAQAPSAAASQSSPNAQSVSAQPISPTSGDTNEQRVAPQQEANTPPLAQPARKNVNTTMTAP